MTKPDAAAKAGPFVEWTDENGPPSPASEAFPTDQSWETLATLGAMIAVWPDLSAGVRRRIAFDAIVAMNRTGQPDDPRD